MNEYYDEYLKQKEMYLKQLGTYEGYVEEECINCGRHRVEIYSSGKKICEKCGYDQEEDDYDYSYCEYFDV